MHELYVWVPNWDGPEGFQHYRNRDPIWIKNYTRLLSHDAYMTLSFTQRGILHGIWLEYASSARRLRGDTLTLTRRLGQRVSGRDIEALNHAGFIELLASDVLAERLQAASAHARPRTREIEEEEREEEIPIAKVATLAVNGSANGSRPRQRDLLFEALTETVGIEPSTLTQSGRGAVNRALKELREAGADESQIRVRAAEFRRRYSVPLTASALTKHWASLSGQEVRVESKAEKFERRLREVGS